MAAAPAGGIAAPGIAPQACPAEQHTPAEITAGPDGNLWFIEFGMSACIGRMTPTGVVTEFQANLGGVSIPGVMRRIPGMSVELADITTGPDGNLWFVGSGGPDGGIGRMTPRGVLTKFRYRTEQPFTYQHSITAGPDGNLWFTTETAGVRKPAGVGRITPTGVVTLFPFESFDPRAITSGPDGNLWATGYRAGADRPSIGRITPEGVLTTFPAGGRGSDLGAIAAGPDGNLWFIQDGNRIGRITPQGRVTMFSAGVAAMSVIGAITAGPDGNLWFPTFGASFGGKDAVGRITPQGRVTVFRAGISAYGTPADITAGPDGNLWFTERDGRIARITPTGLVSEFPPTPAIGLVRLRDTRRVMVPLSCPRGAPWSCRGTITLTLNAPPRGRLGLSSFQLASGQQTTLAVSLSVAGQRLLRSRGGLPLKVTVRPRWHTPGGLGGSVVRYAALGLPQRRAPAVTG